MPDRPPPSRFRPLPPYRVQRCLADFPAVTTLDAYTSAGTTERVPWLGPFTLLLACIAKLAGGAHATVRELASTLGLVPPILGAATAALTVLLARRFGSGPVAALIAGPAHVDRGRSVSLRARVPARGSAAWAHSASGCGVSFLTPDLATSPRRAPRSVRGDGDIT